MARGTDRARLRRNGRPGGATCGHLLSHEGTHIWLDAGTGTFARLQEYIGIADIAAIVITHGHTDHFIDVVPAFYARHYGGMGAPTCLSTRPTGSSRA